MRRNNRAVTHPDWSSHCGLGMLPRAQWQIERSRRQAAANVLLRHSGTHLHQRPITSYARITVHANNVKSLRSYREKRLGENRRPDNHHPSSFEVSIRRKKGPVMGRSASFSFVYEFS